jgi:hypothetical protein
MSYDIFFPLGREMKKVGGRREGGEHYQDLLWNYEKRRGTEAETDRSSP